MGRRVDTVAPHRFDEQHHIELAALAFAAVFGGKTVANAKTANSLMG